MGPRFPDNLPLAALLAWVFLPIRVITARLAFARMGLAPRRADILCGLVAYTVWFGINLMP